MKETKFKNTEIGKMPKDWEVLQFSDILNSAYRGNGIQRNEITEEGIGCIRYGELYTSYGTTFDKCISHTDVNKIKSPKYISKGTIVFALTGESVEDIAKSSVYMGNDDCIIGGDICAISHKENPVYIGYAMEANYALWQKRFGKSKTKVVHSHLDEIVNYYIAIPPKKEQEKIATYLSDVDELIDKLTKLIEKKKLIKKGTMQELLTGKKRLIGFNKEWERTNNIFEFVKGKQVNSNNMDDRLQYPMYNGGQTYSGFVDNYNYENKIIISEGGNSCGFVNLVLKRFWAGGHCYVVTKSKLDRMYLYYLLKLNQNMIMKSRVGSGLPNIQKKELEEIEFIYPTDLEEQKAIANILSNMDTEIEKLEKKLSKYKKIKLAMMDELLIGKTRLI